MNTGTRIKLFGDGVGATPDGGVSVKPKNGVKNTNAVKVDTS